MNLDELSEFKKLGLDDNIILAIKKKGFKNPTEIQQRVIPVFLNKDVDIIGKAQTGTGKTAAFGLPLIQLLKQREQTTKVQRHGINLMHLKKQKHTKSAQPISALILTPTRELAIQVCQELNSFKANKHLNIIPVYGGQPIQYQLKDLEKGVDIVVGTPGRIIDHLNRGSLDLSQLKFLILDEADEMLDMGFLPDIENIISRINSNYRTLLFSATMPKRILKLVEKYMKKYEFIEIKKQQETINLTNQFYFKVSDRYKFSLLKSILEKEKDFYGLIFLKTKRATKTLAEKIKRLGFRVDAINGDIPQNKRERILKNFKNKKITILVATDVAARGIDISNLTHVINYSLPQDPEKYIHRIGRTGRAGKKGIAISFVSPKEEKAFSFVKKITKANIKQSKTPNNLKHSKDPINSIPYKQKPKKRRSRFRVKTR